jgi:hypothetical protein
MALSDYDADATELIETYGVFSTADSLVLDSPLLEDFLMKYIVIGPFVRPSSTRFGFSVTP